jgi:glycosyltransferase involved in cell wall biosynthesis
VRIAIDARPAIGPNKTGVGYYAWHLIRLLPQVDPGTTYVAWYLDIRGALGRPRRPRFFERAAPNLVDRRMLIPSRWFDPLAMRYRVPRIEWLVRSDVFFAPNFVPPPTRTRRLVLTVHDLAFKLYPGTSSMATPRWMSRLNESLKQASRVIVVSEQTRQDLLDLYPVEAGRVSVVPLGVDTELYRPASQGAVAAVRRRYGIEGPYVLSLTAIEPRKNLPAVIRAYSLLDDDVRPLLVIAGPAFSQNPEILRPALEELSAPVRGGVLLTGYVSEEEKAALLSGAEALVYPSLYEGFGLPVIEAMACGTPVLTSNVSALPETAGDAALLVDPRDVEAIADGMRSLLTDREIRRELRVAGMARASRFPWIETARRTSAVLHLACD